MAKRRKSKKNLKQFKRNITRFFIVVGVVTVVSGMCYGLWAIRNITSPLTVSASDDKNDFEPIDDHQVTFFNLELSPKNLIKKASITLIDTDENIIRELSLPEETIVHLPYGLKEFKIQGLYKMAELENSSNIFSVIDQTLIDYFGVSTRNVYITRSNDITDPYYSTLTNPMYIFNLTFNEQWTNKNIITPESRWDLLNIVKKINTIPDQNRKSINILDNEIGYKEADIDQTQIIKTDFNKLDTYIKRTFQSSAMQEEKANISIENGTQITGLGSKVSRLITNMGGVVVSVGNSEKEYPKTEVIINDKKWIDSETVSRIKKAIPEVQISPNINSDNRTDVLLILGNDYAEMVTGH
jgi:hypothetical protein